MLNVLKAEDRGKTQLEWLKSRHTFSFGEYYNPKQMGYSDLRVINDDEVKPASGFGTHSHRDMEIFSYVLSGALEHKDSMGTGSIIRPGDVQLMSAGTGVLHSEFNPSKTEPAHFLQIWIVPNQTGMAPHYQQSRFVDGEKRGKLRHVLSPKGQSGALRVQQDVTIYAGLLNGKEKFSIEIPMRRLGYVHVARGSLMLNDLVLKGGDGVRVSEETNLDFSGGKDAEVLLFDLRSEGKK